MFVKLGTVPMTFKNHMPLGASLLLGVPGSPGGWDKRGHRLGGETTQPSVGMGLAAGAEGPPHRLCCLQLAGSGLSSQIHCLCPDGGRGGHSGVYDNMSAPLPRQRSQK